MSGFCLHHPQTGTALLRTGRPHRLSTLTAARPHSVAFQSRPAHRRNLPYRPLTLATASSTDEAVRDPNDVVKSAENLVDGLQSFIEDAQRELSSDEAPLPEHPIGEPGTLKITDELEAEVIRVPSDFNAREGLKLTDEYTVGKEIGGGVQGRVLTLQRPDGEKTNKLLKVMKYKLATPMTGLDIGLKREWLIGQQLNTIVGDDGELHGFMGTGACILDKESEMPCGLIIEKVNGYAVEKRLTSDETFADVRYILEMCRQIFGYLHTAYTKIGFTHGDLNCANVMEHRGDADLYLPKGFDQDEDNSKFKLPGDKEEQQLEFRIIDYGHARLLKNRALAKLPSAPSLELSYRKWWEGKGDVWRLLQDLAVTIDGRTWPAADEPQVRFLIGLIRKVTGVTIAAFFEGKQGESGYSGRKVAMPWHSKGGFGHTIRMYRMRLWAFSFQRNTQIKPLEALQWMKGMNEYYKVKYGSYSDEEYLMK